MKNKFLILFIGIISFLGISEVKATSLSFSNYYNHFDTAISKYIQLENKINTAISMWEEDYSSTYPYYFVALEGNSNNFLLAFSDSNLTKWYTNNLRPVTYGGVLYYNSQTDSISISSSYVPSLLSYSSSAWYESALINHGFIYKNVPSSWSSGSSSYVSDFETILFPDFTSTNYNFTISSFEIEEDDYVPSYLDLYNDSYILNDQAGYTEINLNNHPYVALSLKDYSNANEFITNVYVKGQYCLTPVYNYGMTERKDILSGSTIERCSPAYTDFNPIRTYILESDIKNHAIYYLKAYDTSHDNIVRVDSNVFDITYITSQTEDNPYVLVNGKSYPAIAYDDLTDSATISEENNYISGASCALGDMNCVSAVTGQSFTFSDLFTNPLQLLKDIWSAIVKVFELITMLISLLPPVLQSFLYFSFMLAIILGIIKILL